MRAPSTRLAFVAAVLAATAGCVDQPAGPVVPAPLPDAPSGALQCAADVRAGSVTCLPVGGGASFDVAGSGSWIFGGQGVFVRLVSSNVSYDAATHIFRADLTLRNLTSDPMGTPDGTTVTGVHVFFHSGPVATDGAGVVEVENADGTGLFTGSDQPFFTYPQIVQPGGTTAPKTWRWTVPDGVRSFGFVLYVESARYAATPAIGDFAMVSVGGNHSCGVLTSGEAFCWGSNDYGKLGIRTGNNFPEPAPVEGGMRFRTISAGARHTCGVATDGRAWCWGNNDTGAVGAPTAVFYTGFTPAQYNPLPTPVNGGTLFRDVDAGTQFNCGVDAQGAARCWGGNEYGQLGTGAVSFEERNPQVVAVADAKWRTVSAGYHHACGVTDENALYCWGNNSHGQLGAASSSTCSVHIDAGEIRSSYPCSPAPLRVDGAWLTVSAGVLATCALDTAGRLYCWGSADFALTPGEITGPYPTPRRVGTAAGLVTVSTGDMDVCALDAAGGALCINGTGPLSGSFRSVSAGARPRNVQYNRRVGHRCAVRSDGVAVCMGYEQRGELGDGGSFDGSNPDPTPVAPLHVNDTPPVASIYQQQAGREVTFWGTFSTDDYGIVEYRWDFGDGTAGTGERVDHAYAAPGTYQVTLTVVDGAGQRSTTAPQNVFID